VCGISGSIETAEGLGSGTVSFSAWGCYFCCGAAGAGARFFSLLERRLDEDGVL